MSGAYVWNWQAAPYLCWQICPWSKNSLLELAACLTVYQETISATASELSPSETSMLIYCSEQEWEYLTHWFRSSSCPSSPAGQDVTYCTYMTTCQHSTRQTNSQTPYTAHTLSIKCAAGVLQLSRSLQVSSTVIHHFYGTVHLTYFWMTTSMCKEPCPKSIITLVGWLLAWFGSFTD